MEHKKKLRAIIFCDCCCEDCLETAHCGIKPCHRLCVICKRYFKQSRQLNYIEWRGKILTLHRKCSLPKKDDGSINNWQLHQMLFVPGLGRTPASPSPPKVSWDTEISPWQENAIRNMEGD